MNEDVQLLFVSFVVLVSPPAERRFALGIPACRHGALHPPTRCYLERRNSSQSITET